MDEETDNQEIEQGEDAEAESQPEESHDDSEPETKTLTQSEIDAMVSKAKRQAKRQARRELEQQLADTGTKDATPKEDTPKPTSDIDDKLAELDFREACADLGIKRKDRKALMMMWKGADRPDMDEFLEEHASIFAPPSEASTKEEKKGMDDAPAVSPRRDPSQITDPRELTKDDIKRLGPKKVREIVEGYYKQKSGGLRRAFGAAE